MDSFLFAWLTWLVPAPQPAVVEAPTMMVGVLTTQYDQKCMGPSGPDVEGTDVEWVNPHFELGMSRVDADKKVGLAGLEGKSVLLTVRPKAGQQAAPVPVKEGMFAASCVPMQMRSDWIPAKTGIRILRGLRFGSRWQGLEATAAKVVRPIELTLSGPDAVAVVQNDLGITLNDVSLEFHYEGCYGKPGSAVEVREVGTLKPGEKKEVRAPQVVDRERTRGSSRGMGHILTSVQMESNTPGVVFDLDLSVSFWSLSVECLEDEKK